MDSTMSDLDETPVVPKPILRKEKDEDEGVTPKRRITWGEGDELKKTRIFHDDSDDSGDAVEKTPTKGKKNVKGKENVKDKKKQSAEDKALAREEKGMKQCRETLREVQERKKLAKVKEEDPLFPVDDNDEDAPPVDEDDDEYDEEDNDEYDEDAPMAIAEEDWEEEEGGALMIDEGEDEEEWAPAPKKSKKKKMTCAERKAKEAAAQAAKDALERRREEILALLNSKDWKDDSAGEIALLEELTYGRNNVLKEKTPEQLKRSLERQLAADRKRMCWETVRNAMKEAEADWEAEWARTMPDVEYDFSDENEEDYGVHGREVEVKDEEEKTDEEEEEEEEGEELMDVAAPKNAARRLKEDKMMEAEEEVVEEKKGKKGGKKKGGKTAAPLEDMPDLDEFEPEVKNARTSRHTKASKRVVEESEGEAVEVKKGKRGGGHKKAEGAAKKKKEEPQTEEEVIADIGKKKSDALDRANRMKAQRREDLAKRREERERKAMEEKKAREEKKMRKKEEQELARKKRVNQSAVDGPKPSSRAEAARRTKKLLLSKDESDEESEDEEMEEREDEEEEAAIEEPQKKKRKYNRRKSTTQPPTYYFTPPESDASSDDEPCGKYVNNPCNYDVEEFCTWGKVSDEDDSSADEDDVLSVKGPFLWTSDKDKLPAGAMGPLNFDADECMKKHLNDVTKFGVGITRNYYKMISKLDDMKLNLFGDSMYRKFNPNVIHSMDSLSTTSCWPADRLPKTGEKMPKFRSQNWKFDAQNPFRGLVRVRPAHMEQDVKTSHDIDVLSGCAEMVPVVTNEDLVDNVKERILSKLRGTKFTPLPSDKNPWDVPEFKTRRPKAGIKDVRVRVKVVSRKWSPAGSPGDRPGAYIKKVDLPTLPPMVMVKQRKRTRKELLKDAPSTKKRRGVMKMEPKDQWETTPRRPFVVKGEEMYNEEEAEGEDEGDDGYKCEWNETEELMANPMNDDHMGEDPFAGYDRMEYDDAEECEEPDDGGPLDILTPFKQGEMEAEESGLGEAFSFMAAHLDG